jgi:hypothetical protein
MSENKSGNGCLWWIIAAILFVALGITITWYVVNDGFKGSLSETIAKLSPSDETTAPTDNLQPNIRPDVRPPTTGQTTPDKNQQDLAGAVPQTGIFGLPGLGLPTPLPAGNPSTPGADVPTAGQPSADVANTGASLDQVKLQSPEDVLKACVANLKRNDIVGSERYVSSNGLSFTLGTTVGVHEVLWKGLFQVQAYQSIGYDAIKMSGQTALVPLYANLGENKTIVAYVVMAHRGDGWKLDHITDPSRF